MLLLLSLSLTTFSCIYKRVVSDEKYYTLFVKNYKQVKNKFGVRSVLVFSKCTLRIPPKTSNLLGCSVIFITPSKTIPHSTSLDSRMILISSLTVLQNKPQRNCKIKSQRKWTRFCKRIRCIGFVRHKSKWQIKTFISLSDLLSYSWEV